MDGSTKQYAKMPKIEKKNSPLRIQRTKSSQSMKTPADRILFLQRTAGNQAVQRLIKSGALQAKLRIGQPGDVYEQEADRVADAVMRMPEPEMQRQVDEEEEEEEKTLQTKTIADQITTVVQRQIEETEEKKKEEKKVPVMTKSLSGETPQISDNIEECLSRTKGLGVPLPADTRTFMGERFGADFSAVGIHTDNETSRVARTLNAEAFTHGRDIYFGAGKYSPGTLAGKRLLAHELTHVMQQTGKVNAHHEINHGVRQNMFKLQLEEGTNTTHSDTFCPENNASDASSSNFSLGEFRCRNGTDVPERFRGNVQQAMNNLEVLRTELENNSITINSGYRTPAYNQSIGGSPQSRHMCGQAADIRVSDHTPTEVADTIETLITSQSMQQGGLGRYSSFVHYDVRGTRARW
ncbi:MAG: DUF4157 domain-containing protein [Candidatus Omnitrophica bacterium]|nr:DUF4157 domain-containing protein [Candidatus Omnitrophota bacterium]